MTLMDLLPITKMESKRNERKKVVIAATLGVTTGVVAGLLLAPKSGKQTWEYLSKNIHKLPKKARVFSEKTQEMMGEAKESIAEETHKIMSEVKEIASNVKK